MKILMGQKIKIYKNNIRIILLFGSFLFSSPVFSAFEPLGYGAAAKGMGGAYTALAEGASASYWNPAILGLIKQPNIMTTYEDLYGLGILRYTGIGYAHPNVGGGGVGFTLLRLETFGEATFLNYAENTYMFTYGRSFGKSKSLSLGAGFRYYSVTADFVGTGLGFDAGLLYRSKKDRFRLAASFQDINEPRVQWGSGTVDTLPPSGRVGILFRFGDLTDFSFEETWRRNDNSVFRMGIMRRLVGNRFIVRSGLFRAENQDRWNYAIGTGLHIHVFDLDYAWEHHEELGDSQTIALSIRFGS